MMSRATESERERVRRGKSLYSCVDSCGGNSSNLALSHDRFSFARVQYDCERECMCVRACECFAFAGVCSNYYFIITFFPLLRFVLCFYVLNAFVVIAALSSLLLVLPRPSLVSKNSHCIYWWGPVFVCVRVFMARRTRTYGMHVHTHVHACMFVHACVCVRT